MIIIDFAENADLPSIHRLHIQALGASFTDSASSKLRNSCVYDPELHLVAREGSMIVGSIQFRSVELEAVGFGSDQRIAYLGPLVTDKKYYGIGLGSKLMDLGLSLIQKNGFSIVFLVGDVDYYSRFGFRSVKPHNITLPCGRDRDRLLYKMLGRPAMLPVCARIVPELSNVSWRERVA